MNKNKQYDIRVVTQALTSDIGAGEAFKRLVEEYIKCEHSYSFSHRVLDPGPYGNTQNIFKCDYCDKVRD